MRCSSSISRPTRTSAAVIRACASDFFGVQFNSRRSKTKAIPTVGEQEKRGGARVDHGFRTEVVGSESRGERVASETKARHRNLVEVALAARRSSIAAREDRVVERARGAPIARFGTPGDAPGPAFRVLLRHARLGEREQRLAPVDFGDDERTKARAPGSESASEARGESWEVVDIVPVLGPWGENADCSIYPW